jgi:peptidoglycan/LPS O-acetylase OafA/YrhL
VRVLERIGRVDWLWWLLAALCFHAVSFWIGLPDNLVLVLGGKAFAREFLYSLTALFLLLPAVFGPQGRGVVRRFLQLRPMVYLGMISYGIYLWHQAFIEKVHQWGGWAKEPLPNGPFLETLIPALALTIVVASLSWYLVEAPLLRRKDRPLFSRRRPAGERARSTAP